MGCRWLRTRTSPCLSCCACRGGPRERAQRFTKGQNPGANLCATAPYTLGQVEIEITRTDLDNGQLSQTVLDQMDEETIEQLLGDTPAEHRSHALNNKLAQHLEQHREALFESLQQRHRPHAQQPHKPSPGSFPGYRTTRLKNCLPTSATPNGNA